jgi:hypothetical protein
MPERTIHKYPLELGEETAVALPEGAEVLCVQTQGGVPQLWVAVDPEARLIPRRFRVRGTGHPLGQVGKYIGTFQMADGKLVFHVFEDAP